MKCLAIHQGSELYGSDRSFAMSVNTFLSIEKMKRDIDLPEAGELQYIIKPNVSSYSYFEDGILRKYSIKKKPIKTTLGLIKRFFYYLNKFKRYDIIYINTIVCFSAILASVFYRKKSIFIHVREIPTGLFGLFFKLLLWCSSAKLIFNSQATKAYFSLEGEVLHNAFDAPTGDSLTVKNGRKLSKNNLRLLLIGRINNWKGQDFALQSFVQYENAKFISVDVLGDVFKEQHYLLNDLKNIATKIDTKVDFHGFSNDPSKYFIDSHFCLVPSLKPEPFGRVAIESLYYGKPVIAANHGGLKEIIEDGVNGFLFEPGDKYSYLEAIDKVFLLSDEEYSKMCKNCTDLFLSKFSKGMYEQKLTKIMGL
jgi:glycosyltransferase involved in cell wall biosynthesis